MVSITDRSRLNDICIAGISEKPDTVHSVHQSYGNYGMASKRFIRLALHCVNLSVIVSLPLGEGRNLYPYHFTGKENPYIYIIYKTTLYSCVSCRKTASGDIPVTPFVRGM